MSHDFGRLSIFFLGQLYALGSEGPAGLGPINCFCGLRIWMLGVGFDEHEVLNILRGSCRVMRKFAIKG